MHHHLRCDIQLRLALGSSTSVIFDLVNLHENRCWHLCPGLLLFLVSTLQVEHGCSLPSETEIQFIQCFLHTDTCSRRFFQVMTMAAPDLAKVESGHK